MMYITPENVKKTKPKTKINGINENICICQNSLTEKKKQKSLINLLKICI